LIVSTVPAKVHLARRQEILVVPFVTLRKELEMLPVLFLCRFLFPFCYLLAAKGSSKTGQLWFRLE
jgi:hypothetical protein